MLSLLPHWDDGGKRVDRGLVGAEGGSLFMVYAFFALFLLSSLTQPLLHSGGTGYICFTKHNSLVH